jgi:glucose-6-phosphate 1-dehydrogenase
MKDPELQPAIIVIFGITGDLAGRYLLPALYHLMKDSLLHEQTEILGITRRDVSVDDLLDKTKLNVLDSDEDCDMNVLKRMHDSLSMFKMDLDSGTDYDHLKERLDEIETKHGMCMNRLYYLSIPPDVYQPIVALLGEHDLNKSCQHNVAETRLLVEKPFGHDLASAQKLITETAEDFNEDQVYRIDHYLAKETVQNILAFRSHNPIFEALWSNQYVASIDIAAKETIGIEGRVNFYEQTGALRDLIQSHLLQLLAATTMEPATSANSDSIHAERLKLLESVEPVPQDKVAERTVRGQYEGYRDEVGNPNSSIETFAAIQLFIHNKRWEDTPITIRTGKALDDRATTIDLTFKRPEGSTHHPNVLTFSVQPREGIGVDLYVKRPGFDHELQMVPMDFRYDRNFGQGGHPNAYERVIVDAIRGDRTLFATGDEVIASWQIIEPILEGWAKNINEMQPYKAGSEGPALTPAFKAN